MNRHVDSILLGLRLPVLTVHLRTRKEFEVDAHWDLMPNIIRLRDEVQSEIPVNQRTIILGNGDARDLNDARTKISTNGYVSKDGTMITPTVSCSAALFSETHGCLIKNEMMVKKVKK